jgi:hypothetical protein
MTQVARYRQLPGSVRRFIKAKLLDTAPSLTGSTLMAERHHVIHKSVTDLDAAIHDPTYREATDKLGNGQAEDGGTSRHAGPQHDSDDVISLRLLALLLCHVCCAVGLPEIILFHASSQRMQAPHHVT